MPPPLRRRRLPSSRLLLGGLLAVVGAAALAAGGGLGYWLAGGSAGGQAATAEAAGQKTVKWWTCSMHPQVKLPHPGKCPICFMDLIPLEDDSSGDPGPRRTTMSPAAVALAEIQTTPVRRQAVTKVVRLVGKIDYDETRLANIAAWVPGRLDRLYVDFTGTTVRKGDHLVSMYSPDLVEAQTALLLDQKALDQARPGADRATLQRNLKNSEDRLRLWGLLDAQIDEIKKRGTPSEHLTIYAPVGGIVIQKHANEGAYVETGTKIYTIADLTRVWMFLDAYESDVPWLRFGQDVEFTTETYPGEVFHGRIAFIDPVLNEKTRTVRVRVNVPNEQLKLKPGMFVRALVRSRLAAGGRVFDASLAGKWICPMHPEEIGDGPGKCSVCGMDLVPAEQLGFVASDQTGDPPLVIPDTAPLLTGKRAVVYVRVPGQERPTFEGREVMLGERTGGYYIVRYGLGEGEEVVTKGNFKIDSALQIQAKASMMNPDGGMAAAGHQHGPAGAGAGSPAAGQQPQAHAAGPAAVPDAFRARLAPLFDAYVKAAAALADDDFSAARDGVAAIRDGAPKVTGAGLDAAAQARWKQAADRLVLSAYEAADAADIDALRRRFDGLSQAVRAVVEGFGNPLANPLEVYHCPMAFNGKGADWLQPTGDVRNPYFGAAMLRCGEKQQEFASQAPVIIPAGFAAELDGVYRAYLSLQQSLADDRLDEACAAWQMLRQSVADVDAGRLEGRALNRWQSARDSLTGALSADLAGADLADVRRAFEPLSTAVLAMAERFGPSPGTPLYQAYCPMAFNNRGAAWLQADRQIANPYFGHQMRGCGEIRREFAADSAAGGGEDRK